VTKVSRIPRDALILTMIAGAFSFASAEAAAIGRVSGISASIVVDKSTRGTETVRALLRNESGHPIVVASTAVTYYAALGPSDPKYYTTPPELTPSRDFHVLGAPCLFEFHGPQSVTVTGADGQQTTYTVTAPPSSPRPEVSTAPSEVIASGESKSVGPIEHFGDFQCGETLAHTYRVYGVIRWTYRDEVVGGKGQTTTSPTITVSIP
jgi:hypothetical protein